MSTRASRGRRHREARTLAWTSSSPSRGSGAIPMAGPGSASTSLDLIGTGRRDKERLELLLHIHIHSRFGSKSRNELFAEPVHARVHHGVLHRLCSVKERRGGDGAQVIVLEHLEGVDEPAVLEEDRAALVVLLHPKIHVQSILGHMRVVRAQALELAGEIFGVLEKMPRQILSEHLKLPHRDQHIDHELEEAGGQLQPERAAAQIESLHGTEQERWLHGLVLEERLEDLLVKLLKVDATIVARKLRWGRDLLGGGPLREVRPGRRRDDVANDVKSLLEDWDALVFLHHRFYRANDHLLGVPPRVLALDPPVQEAYRVKPVWARHGDRVQVQFDHPHHLIADVHGKKKIAHGNAHGLVPPLERVGFVLTTVVLLLLGRHDAQKRLAPRGR
mmetsp:Transcript_3925/g.11359  ORF Transcript_3925/g.11359 Transcript_3925/m.11359 type:complete len:390 (+) Transcript_3925:770-1939(+)